ncbi:MAG: HvfC/BufC family peptide modification chaperone, partial [Methylocella sp.]
YRNNVNAALTNALRVRYPVVEKLLGPRTFAAIAGEFVWAHPPQSPVLIQYGGDYPEFIAAKAQFPYIADVARLESLWWRAYHAADIESVAAAGFAKLTPENLETARFKFHPSAGIMSSLWAIGDIWEAVAATDVARPQSVLVWRSRADVQVRVIDKATAAFLGALMDGKGVLDAIGDDAASSMEARFQMLIESQLVTSIEMVDQ